MRRRHTTVRGQLKIGSHLNITDVRAHPHQPLLDSPFGGSHEISSMSRNNDIVDF